jgi:hypothetical protein
MNIERIDLSKPRWCRCGAELPTAGALKTLKSGGLVFSLLQEMAWTNGMCRPECREKTRPTFRVLTNKEDAP